VIHAIPSGALLPRKDRIFVASRCSRQFLDFLPVVDRYAAGNNLGSLNRASTEAFSARVSAREFKLSVLLMTGTAIRNAMR
jgi:hypothetical protein